TMAHRQERVRTRHHQTCGVPHACAQPRRSMMVHRTQTYGRYRAWSLHLRGMGCLRRPFCFFFSSRRRHTRFSRDWSSDVCSSDLLAIENIDIGGPTMVRSAAKNHAYVGIVVNTADYALVLNDLQAHNGLRYKTRFNLALKAFEHTSAYDGMIANYLGTIDQSAEELSTDNRLAFPQTFNSQFIKAQDMRYGENPHQHAAF